MSQKVKIIISAFLFLPFLGCAQNREPGEHTQHEHQQAEHEAPIVENQIPRRIAQAAKPALEGKVSVQNNTGQILNFSVSSNNKDWSNQTIQTGHTLTWTTSGFYIAISSTTGQVSYFLPSGYSYSLGWNSQKGVWDVFLDP